MYLILNSSQITNDNRIPTNTHTQNRILQKKPSVLSWMHWHAAPRLVWSTMCSCIPINPADSQQFYILIKSQSPNNLCIKHRSITLLFFCKYNRSLPPHRYLITSVKKIRTSFPGRLIIVSLVVWWRHSVSNALRRFPFYIDRKYSQKRRGS